MKKTTIKKIKQTSREELPLPASKVVPSKKKKSLDNIARKEQEKEY